MNYDYTVIIFMALTLISSTILFIGKYSARTHVLVLMFIALFLLLFPQILSPYIIGIDAHWERVIAKNTIINGHWNPNLVGNVVNGALSIAILAPAVSLIAGVSMDMVTKIIFSLFAVLHIPIIWKINKKVFHFSNRSSFISVLLVVGTSGYMLGSIHARQEVALFIMLLLTYFIFSEKRKSFSLTLVTILLFIGLTISHYTTAIFFIAILFSSSIIMWMLTKKEKFEYMLTVITFLIFWTMFVVYATMIGSTYSVLNILTALLNWAIGSTSIVVQQQLNPSFGNVFSIFNYLINILLIALISLGVVISFYMAFIKKRCIKITQQKYIVFSSLAAGAIFFSLLPGISLVYNPERIFITVLLICSGFMVIGLKSAFLLSAIIIRKVSNLRISTIKVNRVAVLFCFVIVLCHLILQVGVPQYTVYNDTGNKYFGDIQEDFHYTFKGEVNGIQWLKDTMDNKTLIFTDFYGRGQIPLQSYGMFARNTIITVKDKNSIHADYPILFYQQKSTIAKENQLFSEDLGAISQIQRYLDGNNLIYNSGTAKVFSIF
ncbi:MAG: DUF2206 domain-containing protein [Candidatus Methanoperedens sp.]|nr:DUF2206 domain-containing protein [Candidatus Methanoperedens sp.]PKP54390.1 MAG: hypothetical protein CVT90_01500 [Candidatus Altiarchaeales archaeon HGW-Altiarchaeales-3]